MYGLTCIMYTDKSCNRGAALWLSPASRQRACWAKTRRRTAPLSQPGLSTRFLGGKLVFVQGPKSKGGFVPRSGTKPEKSYRRIGATDAEKMACNKAARSLSGAIGAT
ncbi:hypothetical protein Y032_0041g367 [Ancylostoma ceylanicum]|uniref:Uncharacterized protein n=1 Tax=Ancylostoma ceylanicum TaxID=53326 RepID=A0A016UHS4_9BILA|nr:hypothetical protein Y032_0041g367 [Ancylostoma ceylanicum]